jgi:prepilin-type N-terminal cleavage/methylation domain-containing protein
MRPGKKDSLKHVGWALAHADDPRRDGREPHGLKPILQFPASNSHGGFTFVELLVTMALLSILLPVVMQTISLCTRIGGQSRRQIEAVCLAKTRLTELTTSQEWANGNSQGDFGTDWPGYEWALTVANWTEDAAVRQLELTVFWRSVGRQREVTLSTLVYPQEQ